MISDVVFHDVSRDLGQTRRCRGHGRSLLLKQQMDKSVLYGNLNNFYSFIFVYLLERRFMAVGSPAPPVFYQPVCRLNLDQLWIVSP